MNTIACAAALLTLWAGSATAQTAQQVPGPADSGFSFAVYGDSRSMMYLPSKSDQKEEATTSLTSEYRAEWSKRYGHPCC
jgi:hypothetical protein